MTIIYELDPYSQDVYRVSENVLPTLRLSKVILRHKYIHTYVHANRQTDAVEIIYHAA